MKSLVNRGWLSVLGAIGVVLLAGSVALAVPAAPSLERPIVDQTGTLSDEQIDSLAAQINSGRKEKSYQLAILMIPTLGGASLEDYSIQTARAWGIGEKNANNGVLLFIAKDDRRLRIEVGSGLEGDLTDAESGRIIRNVITPRFKQGDFFGGISAGVTSIQAQVEGRPDPASGKEGDLSLEDVPGAVIAVVFVGYTIISWLGAILARSKSWWGGGIIGALGGAALVALAGLTVVFILIGIGMILFGLLFDWLVSRNYRHRKELGLSPSWWAGGGSSSGGGGSFGGGGFSGGGASGSW